MALQDVTDESFRDLYKNNDIVVLDFWATWCGPCHAFLPVFESVAEKFPNIPFGKVEVDSNPRLSSYFAVRSVPTLLVVREELEVYRGSSLSEADLVRLVEQIKEADMDEVRQKLGVED